MRIPSPKNAAEEFKFSFNSVYEECTQEDLFNNEGMSVEVGARKDGR